MRSIFVLAVLFFCLAIPGVCAQSAVTIPLGIPGDDLLPNQNFTLELKFPDEGISEPQITMPPIPARISLVSGPQISRGPGVDARGKRGSFVAAQYTFRTNYAGYAVIGPFSIQYGTRTYQTEASVVGIMSSPVSRFVPPDLEWHVHATNTYQGQVFLLTLDLRYASSIVFPQKVDLTMPSTVKAEEVSDLGEIENEQIGGRDFSRVPVSAWIITPLSSGQLTFPAVHMPFQDTFLNALPKTVNLLPLPPEMAGAGNAIGAFQFSAFLGKARVAQNEPILLTVRVEGEGNLNSLQLPALAFPDLQILGSSDNSKFVPSESGYRGFRETVYRLAAAAPGNHQLTIPAFVWLGTGGVVRSVPSTVISLAILAPGQVPDNQTPHELPLLTIDEIKTLRPLHLYRTAQGFPLLIPGVLLLVFAGARRFLGKAHTAKTVLVLCVLSVLGSGATRGVADSATDWESSAKLGIAAYQRHDFQEAWRQFESARSLDAGNPGILYDLALASHEKNADAESLFHVQAALRMLPDNAVLRGAMLSFEKNLGLEHQLAIVALPAPDILYIVVVASLALIGLIVIFRGWRTQIASLFSFLFVGCIGVCALGLLIFAIVQERSDIGVVSEAGTSMRKIPDRAAASWLTVAAGTTLRIIADNDNFSLVETAYGVEGWVETGVLYRAQP